MEQDRREALIGSRRPRTCADQLLALPLVSTLESVYSIQRRFHNVEYRACPYVGLLLAVVSRWTTPMTRTQIVGRRSVHRGAKSSDAEFRLSHGADEQACADDVPAGGCPGSTCTETTSGR